MRAYIREGTAIEGLSKCASCSNAHIIRGYRESEEMVFCDYASDLIRIPFKVRECSNYRDRTSPDWDQMQKLAIDVQPTSSAKPAGFRLARDGDPADAAEEVDAVQVGQNSSR